MEEVENRVRFHKDKKAWNLLRGLLGYGFVVEV